MPTSMLRLELRVESHRLVKCNVRAHNVSIHNVKDAIEA